MSNKYNRHQAVISRNSESELDEDHWLNQFQKKLIEKDAVQPKSVDRSLFDQISSIMNNKSKYPSVAAAVEDMKERSGLSAFLNNINKTSVEDSSQTTKQASDQNSVLHKKVKMEKKLPIVIMKCPQIETTLDNVIKSTRGNLSISAILNKIRSIHEGDVSDAKDWDSNDLIIHVSQKNLAAKSENTDANNSSQLGSLNDVANDDDIDPANTDAFSGLVPATNY